jgi:hypothetical protein
MAFADKITAPWTRSHGAYLSGQAALDDVDILARDREIRWGAGRLRLIVGADLRDKFDRQRYKLQQAAEHGDLEAVRVEARRMQAAWRALDRAATEAGASIAPPDIWEGVTPAGVVVAIVRRSEDAHRVAVAGRALAVYTLDEIVRMLGRAPALCSAMAEFPGARVTAIREALHDPLNAVDDVRAELDALLQDDVAF